jgi:hypothetical protein
MRPFLFIAALFAILSNSWQLPEGGTTACNAGRARVFREARCVALGGDGFTSLRRAASVMGEASPRSKPAAADAADYAEVLKQLANQYAARNLRHPRP